MTSFDLILLSDALAPPRCGAFSSILATCAFALVAFLAFAAILGAPLFFGKKLKRRCACAASKEVVRVVEERERAKWDAATYSPETVDAKRLPTLSQELVDATSGARR